MKRAIIVAILSIVAAGNVLAADFPPPEQASAMYVPMAVYNWGGIYFGVNGGYGFGTSDFTGGVVSSSSFSTSGGVAGGTLGFNLQYQTFVFSVETDFDYDGIRGNGPAGFCAACSTSTTWLGTVRGRAGYAVDRVLFYGTAGGAYGDVQANVSGVTNSATKFGWTAGGGIEAALADQWTARLEYLYVDLGNTSCTTACGAPPTQTVSFTQNLIRAGIDFKFR